MQERLIRGTVINSLPGLSRSGALSSGSGSQRSSAGAFCSPESAAAPGGSETRSDPRADKHTHILPI